MKRSVFFVLSVLSTFLVASVALAQHAGVDDATAAWRIATGAHYGWFAIAAALAIGLPALGGALGQGRAAAAALEGIARNPGASGKIFVPMILGMALIESLVLFGLLIAFVLSGNIK
jgi:F-type H+-transporting ATPase subunit c